MPDPIRVLYVGEDPEAAARAAESLERESDRIGVVAETPREADPSRIAGEEFDCVVASYPSGAEDGDGVGSVAELADRTPDLPFILFAETGSAGALGKAVAAATGVVPNGDGEDRFAALAERVVSVTEDARTDDREEALAALHDAATDLQAAEDEDELYEILVEAAEGILEFDFVSVDAVEGDQLVARAMSRGSGDYFASVPLDADDNLGVRAYRNGETILADDLREYDVTPADPEYRSALTVPIGKFGTFQAGSREVEAFGEGDVELTELLVGHARETLRRLDHERSLRRQREQLARENERLDEFASLVSHDLRNPLTVASSALELVEEECDSPHLDSVGTSLERMETIIDDVLEMARSGHVVEDDELDGVDIASVARTCWTTVETENATLVVDSSGVVVADPDRLRRVLENLFRNSVEHSSTGSRSGADDSVEHGSTSSPPGADDRVERGSPEGETAVTIRVGTSGEDGFYVADDGPGIPEEERDSVFEPGHTTTDDGTGFGLAIVRRIAEAHGWDVRATGSASGGARIEFAGVDFEEQ